MFWGLTTVPLCFPVVGTELSTKECPALTNYSWIELRTGMCAIRQLGCRHSDTVFCDFSISLGVLWFYDLETYAHTYTVCMQIHILNHKFIEFIELFKCLKWSGLNVYSHHSLVWITRILRECHQMRESWHTNCLGVDDDQLQYAKSDDDWWDRAVAHLPDPRSVLVSCMPLLSE